MDRRLFWPPRAGVSGLCAAIAQTPPAAAPPTRIRGTIASVDGQRVDGQQPRRPEVEVTLNDPLTVVSVKKLELSAIEPNSFIGTATRTGADGKQTAIEVLVFPEAMRGAGEGHYPWDLEPGSMMTNGTVKGAVTASSGRELTVGYKDSTPRSTCRRARRS